MSADWTEMRYLEGRDFIPDTKKPSRRWLEKYVQPDDQPHVMATVQEAIRTKSTFQLEHRVIRVDGTLGWTLSRAIPLFDECREITEWVGMASDVTERKRAEEALARMTVEAERQQRLYQTILSNTPDLVYVFDLNHRFIYANDALLTMWGRTWDEAIGKNCLELGYEPWHAAMHDREIEQVIATKLPIRGEVPFTGTQGRRIYDYIFVPVIGADGEVEAIAGTTRDVTERKQAEEASRAAAERFRFLAESMPQKIFTAKPNGDVDYFNQQWTEFTGLPFEQIKGWGWTEFVHPEDVDENVRVWQQSIQTGEPFNFEHRFRRHDGIYRWHISRAHSMRDVKGNVIMWIGSDTDIDDQKRAQEELRRLIIREQAARVEAESANRMKDEFIAVVSHELRTPLTAVLGWAHLLRLGAEPDKATQAAETIERNARGLNQIIDDLLDVSRIITGKLRLDVRPIDPCAVAADAIETLTPAAAAKGVTLQKTVPTQVGLISGDPDRLQQVAWNLASNGIKFTPRGGKVDIRVERVDSDVQIIVTDTGSGIKSDFLPFVFDRF
jgi:PAS domain S-box-containing protein